MPELHQTQSLFLSLALARGVIDAQLADQAAASGTDPSTFLLRTGAIDSGVVRAILQEVDLQLPTRIIAGHRILNTLGQGGMGVVYRATQLSVDRMVALKVLDQRLSQGDLAERFLREAKTAARINSPHVVTVYDAGRDGDLLYLTMELVLGGDAAGLVHASGGRLEARRAVEIVHDAAQGLVAIAAAGLIHRDIKPANIFLTEGGAAKLADLGLSRPILAEERVTIAGEILGTPAFMSPEQAQGHELDIRSDIYALGATLYALITGRSPYQASSPMATAALVITEPFPDCREFVPRTPRAVVALIQRATARDPARRYQTPEELVAALGHLRNDPLSTDPESTGLTFYLTRGLRALRPSRRPLLLPLVGVACLALALVAVLVAAHTHPVAGTGLDPAHQRALAQGRIVQLQAQEDADRQALTAAQAEARTFARERDDPAAGEDRDYLGERAARWDAYVAALAEDPTLVAVHGALALARSVLGSAPTAGLAALDRVQPLVGAWAEHRRSLRDRTFTVPLLAWCLDHARSGNRRPLERASIELGEERLAGRALLAPERALAAGLDRPEPPPAGILDALERIRAIDGAQDADLMRWRARLAAIAQARAACAAFTRPQDLTDADAQALARLAALVGPRGDPLLGPAQDKLEAHRALERRLRPLAAAAAPPPPDRDADLAQALSQWEALFGADARTAAWRARLEEDRRWQELQRPFLERYDPDHAAPGAVDVDLLAQALDAATRLHAGSEQELARWSRALAIARLRLACALPDHPAPLPPAAAAALAQLTALVGAADPEVRASQAHLDQQRALAAVLVELDPERPLPTRGLERERDALERWRALCGTGAPWGRWQERLALAQRWARAQPVLAAIDQGTVDPNAVGEALLTASLVRGERDADVQRWSARVRAQLPWWPVPWASRSGRDATGAWAECVVAGVVQRLRWMPPGHFLMGSPPEEPGRDESEATHPVTLTRGFWLADSECTQGLWQAVMGGNPSHGVHDPQRPVEHVSWAEAQAFCQALARQLPGPAVVRLPTEAEWEYACRAGTSTIPTGRALAGMAWDSDTSDGEAQPVRQKAPNAWGLYDMLGNVDEWCADVAHPFTGAALTDPSGPATGPQRSYRGGAYDSDPEFCRPARRGALEPDRRRDDIGLRLAISASP